MHVFLQQVHLLLYKSLANGRDFYRKKPQPFTLCTAAESSLSLGIYVSRLASASRLGSAKLTYPKFLPF